MTAASKDLVKSLVAQRSSTFIWKINNFKTTLEKLQRKNAPELESDIFITTEYGYQIRAKLLSDYTSGFTSFKIGFIKTDKPLPPIYYHRRTFIIVDQSSNREKADIEVVEEPGFGDGDAKRWMNGYLGPFNFPPITLIRKNDTYIKNDTIIIKILIEPLEALYKVFTNSTGVLVWKIENYTKRQQQEIDGVVQCLRSDYFYSSEGGYRMQTLLYLNGIRKENRSKHLSVCHCFQRGEWDDCLPPKFFHKTTCAILDPSDLQLRKRLLTKSKVANGTFWDCFDDFAALEDIANTTYMKNDTLVIEVTVESQ